eukprot:COSAG06_NODE_2463_length_6830_cov_17.476155_3_plen_44_part_00
MKGNTFFDAENEMRSIGGHRFGMSQHHTCRHYWIPILYRYERC